MINPNKSNPKARTGKDIFNLVRSKQSGPAEVKIPKPAGEVQETLVVLWSKVLNASNFDTNDDFFKSGGNSIKAVQLASQVAKHFSVHIDLTDIFLNTSITSQAVLIGEKKKQFALNTPIQPQERPVQIPLSFSQERLWFIEKLEGSIQYHIPLVFSFKGQINVEALEASLKDIVARHEVLRTIIKEEDGKPYQFINSAESWQLEKRTLIDPSDESTDVINQLVSKPFNLAGDYMLRATLMHEAALDHLLVLVIHHIASDGWSMSVMAGELIQLYQQHCGLTVAPLSALPLQYADYALWQKKQVSQEQQSKKLEFWKSTLEGMTPLSFPTDFPRPITQSTRGSLLEFSVPSQLASAISVFSNQQGVTLFNTLLAAFNVLLYRYTNQQDVCVGTVVANRPVEDLENLIGFFTNTIPIRNTVNGEASFTGLLQQVKETTLSAFAYQDVPVEKIIDTVVTERDLSRHPLFNIVFVLQNTPDIPALEIGDLKLSQIPYHQDTTKFDITFNLKETANGIEGEVEYCIDLFTEVTINRFVEHYVLLLASIIHEPAKAMSGLNILGEDERHQLLKAFNNTHFPVAAGQTMVSLFEEQVAKNSSAIALVFQNEQLTYAELNNRANQLAHYLQAKGVKPEMMVPICVERSVEMMIGILGILKAGAAYVPIDPEYPQARIQLMMEDTAAIIVVSSKACNLWLQNEAKYEIVEIEEATINQPVGNLKTVIKPHHLAYVIYTSGSTGKPKGVMIEHSSLVNYLLNSKTRYISEEKGNTGTFIHLSYTFDASLTGMFMPLISGRSIVISCKSSIEVFEDVNLLKYAPYDFIKITPAHLELLKATMENAGESWLTNKLVIGGEALYPGHFDFFVQKGIEVEIINEYGPTEATVGCSTYNFLTLSQPEKITNGISIGKPINNVQLYITVEGNDLSPIGVAGEICIGGSGLARGYLNRPELTAEKFIKNPFSTKEGSRLYKTGDVGRWSADGNIEYLGRIDEQVKILGYRIELGEIESVLLQNSSISQGVVVATNDTNGNKKLIGYVVAKEFDKELIIADLQSKLPIYMVPALWVQLQSMPLTSNGKIDRKALPDLDLSDLTLRTYVAPESELEIVLAGVWKELLGVERVGTHDNFFELGGDSITTIQVVSRVNRLGYHLQPKDIFLYQSISKLAAAIVHRSALEVTAEQGILTGACGLLPIQSSFLEHGQPGVSHFNQSVLLSVDKTVSEEILREALKQLLAHHDALRFKYYQQDGGCHQEYGRAEGRIIIEDLRSEQGALNTLITERTGKHQGNLDIKKGEIVLAVLIQTPDTEAFNRLEIIIHHLAVDGVSWRILLGDLGLLITQLTNKQKPDLGSKGTSYRQWYNALVQYGKSERLLSQKTYWQHIAKSWKPIRVNNEYAGEVRVKNINQHIIRLGSEHTQKLLYEVPKVYHTEINDILLAALAKTLCDWSETEKVVIGLEGHGREHIADDIDVSRTVGWFTTLFPIMLNICAGTNNSDLIKTVKEQLRQVPDKGLGYGVLKYINGEVVLRDSQCWDIVFNYLGQLDNAAVERKWLKDTGGEYRASRDEDFILDEKLSVNALVQSGELLLYWNYSNKHFFEDTITALATSYITNLTAIIEHCIEQAASVGVVYTPSDYGIGGEVSYKELDKFLEEPYKGKARKEQIDGLYRLSGLQQGMLFHSLYNKGGGAYVEQFTCDLVDPDLNYISKSWRTILNHYSILRSGFYHDSLSVPIQCVYKEVELPIEVFDYRTMDSAKQSTSINEYKIADRIKGFDLKVAPLMRLALIRLTNERYRLVWSYHHILFDGWSMPLLMEEFLSGYELLATGKDIKAGDEDFYEDYIRYLQRIDKEKEEAYWRKYLIDIEQSTFLPFIAATAERTREVGSFKSLALQMDAATTALVQSFARKHHITVNTIMQGVWSYLLHGYTGSKKIIFGVTVSGRPDDLSNVERRVGMYVNTVPLKSILKEKQGTLEWLQILQQDQVQSRQYQYTPLQQVQGWANVQGDLFDSLLIFENYPFDKIIQSKHWKLQVSNVEMHEQTNFPLTILVSIAGQIDIKFNYNSHSLADEYVEELKDHFENVLLQVINNVDGIHSGIRLLSTQQEQRLLSEFNDTYAAYPNNKTIVDLFEEQVAKTPDAIALIFDEEQLSYLELNERANQLAYYLTDKGVKQETLVPVCIHRGIQMIIGMLGVLKAGAAYVPVDPEYPVERISYMLEDTGASIAVSSSAARLKIESEKGLAVIELDTHWEEISKQSTDNLQTDVAAHNLAYVIYTSGSTGKPKGVMIEHHNVYSFISWCKQEFASSHFEIAYASTSICFDLSVYEIFYPLSVGKPVRILENGLHIGKYLSADRFVLVNSVPVVIENLLKQGTDLSNISVLNMAGEPISSYVQHGLDTEKIQVRNLYGPTEDTTYSTVFTLKNGEPIWIGKPISNTSVYILHNDKELAPIGITGEICIGGSGLARGYLNRPELTAEKFIRNPFSNEQGSRLYKTGDLGRWLPDGNIEYLGRIDDQVKIRGYRIELGEIETVLLQSGLVDQAVVIAKEDGTGNKRLVGYVVTKEGFDKLAIITFLQSKLPEHMVPAVWVSLASLPLTPNGKIDRKALPDVDADELLSNQYIAPRNEAEAKLVDIWKQLLNVERVGINDNFFELGGHSLLAMRVVSAVRKELHIEVEMKKLFQNPTIAAFAKQVTNGTGGLLQPSISAILPRPSDIPLSFSQERLWFIDRLEGSIQYHIPSVLRLKGSLNRSALSHALETLVNRHEVLRTVYIEKAGQAYQFVSNKNEWKLSIIDGGIFNEDQSQLQQYIEAEISRPFDLTKDYMLRAVLIVLDKQEHLLVVTMHHIASDGWSLSIMVNEIAEAYSAYNEGRVTTLNPLEVQYADYAIWQRNYLNNEVLNNKIRYWKEKLRDVVSLQLPATYKRPVVQSTRGAIVAFDIDNGLTSQLYELGKQTGATLFMTLLGVFNILMHRYSGQEDICVGSPIANRTQNEVEGMIGFFVNTLALRSSLKGDMLFADLLQQGKDTTMEAYANQDVPFEKVVEAVVRVRDVSRTPLFQVMFALNNTPAVPALHLGGLHLSVEEARHTTSQFDLSFNIIENAKRLNGVVEYCTDLYDDKAIQRMIIHFKNLVSSIVQSPAQKIGKLSMLSPAENYQLLEEFNNTATAYPKNKSIVDLFEEQVIKTPGETAIVFEGQQLTYNELNGRSNQLANYLNKIGVEPGNNIGLLSPRGPDMIISIFGILKAGCTYVPFNVEYPAERLNYIIEDAEIKHIICPSLELIPSAGFENCKIIHPEEAFSCSSNSYKISIAVDAPAYIMYTSGTTGKPKGIAVSHKNILKLVFEPGVIKVNPQDRMLQWSNFAFDGSVYEIFCSLLVGASLHLIKDDWSSNVFELNRVIEEQNITICFVTTALFNSFIDINPGMLKGLRKILFGGELVSPSHVKKALHTAGANKIIHVYGPTETTVYATCYAIDEVGVQGTIPIGKPLSNTSLYVLDNYLQLVPVGVTGELFIGGDGVSLGYVNNKILTDEKFIGNHLRDAEVDRIYRTGDLVRMLPDGNIEYLGRKDNQVKIRGYRIEPEEIEGLVLESGLVQQAVVMVKEDSNSNKRLVGYISTDKDFDKQMLNNYLHARLPAYMVPGLWVEMSSMPLNANGKIDKKALPYTDSDQLLTNTYVAPRTELEERLVKIWMDLLGLERVGVEDNFFELGGHSLLAMRLISAIQRELNLQVAVKELFEFTTISELSKYLEIRSGVPEKDKEAYDLLVI